LTEEEGAVLLHLDTGAYHGLNPTGTLIWDLIGEGTTFGEILDGVRARLADAPADLSQDVAAFVADLAERDLLVVEGPEG
jgi:hypothetical protein